MKRAARFAARLIGHAITALMAALLVMIVMPGADAPDGASIETALIQKPLDQAALQPPPEPPAPPPVEPSTPTAPSDIGAPAPEPTIEAVAALENAAAPEAPRAEERADALSAEPLISEEPPQAAPDAPETIEAEILDDAALADEEVAEEAEAASSAPAEPQTAAQRCGDARLVGLALEPLTDPNEPACGAPEPIALEAIVFEGGRVTLSPAPRMRCDLALRLADWMETEAAPAAITAFGEPMTTVTVVDSYTCRRRRGGDDGDEPPPLSEHGRANAIDMAAFTMESGRVVRVVSGWNGAPEEAVFLRFLWTAACDRFGTVLGPDANAAHRDHFHFDAVARRSAYCR